MDRDRQHIPREGQGDEPLNQTPPTTLISGLSPVHQGQFLAKMSHELRTPLNSVLGLIELASRRPVDELTRYYLQRCLESSQHLRALIDDILDFSKLEAGRIQLKPAPCGLRAVLRQAVVALPSTPHPEAVSLFLEIQGEALPDQVRVDALRLAQILINLVGNALKFTTQGTVILRLTGLGWQGEGDDLISRCRFEVEDTGPGIPDDLLPRLYKLYEQANDDPATASTGTGLGLAISRQLVQAMGSDLHVKTELGLGTTFWFELDLPSQPLMGVSPWTRGLFDLETVLGLGLPSPAFSKPAQPLTSAGVVPRPGIDLPPAPWTPGHPQVQSSPPSAGSLRGRRLLVVDDNENNRMVARGLLEEAGALVEFAENGLVGVERLRRMAQGAPSIDLVLLDWQMPGMDGLQAVRHIRRELGLTHLPVLAMTANVSEEDRMTCLQAGMNDHLGKPLSSTTLLQTVLTWLPASSVGGPLEDPGSADPDPSERFIADPDVLSHCMALATQADVDLLAGLRRLNGRVDLYAQSLAAELQAWPQTRQDFVAVLQGRQAPSLRRLLHAQKGVFATLGFHSLNRSVVALESRLKTRPTAWAEDPAFAATIDQEVRALLALMDQLELPLQALLAAVQQPVRERSSQRADGPSEPAQGALWQRLHTLARRMSRYEMDAVTLMNELEGDLRRLLPASAFTALQRHMAVLDFAAARRIVELAVETSQSTQA